MNYYVLLGVPRTADAETIRSAFRALARRYHPDAGSGSSAEKFCQIVQAYETLIDPVARGRYDRSLTPASVRPRVSRTPRWSSQPEPLIPHPPGREPLRPDARPAVDPMALEDLFEE